MNPCIGVGPSRQSRRVGGGHRPVAGETELTGEYRTQIGHAAPLGGGTVDLVFRAEREVLPHDFQSADQAERYAVGIQMRPGCVDDQPFDQFAHQRGEALVLLSANVVVFLPGTRLAPKRVPNRNLAGTGNVRVEIQIDHQLERRNRGRLEFSDRYQQPLLEFGGEELQGCDQHRGLGVEVESDNAR